MLLRHLTARMAMPGAKAAAGIVTLLRPITVRAAISAAGSWSPASPTQHMATRGQHQQVRSYTYEAAGMEAGPEIGEVDFDPVTANSVHLIGVVGGKKDLRVFERSKLLPFAIGIKSDPRRRDEIEWINVEAWGPLAERADAALQKGDRVAVQGRLKVNKWEDAAGTTRTAYKITANSISKVRSMYPAAASGAGSFDQYAPAAASVAAVPGSAPWDVPAETAAAPTGDQPWEAQQEKALHTTEEKWMDYFTFQDSWWDNRNNKKNPKAPDFKKKGSRDAPALWISSSDTPPWVQGELDRMDSGRQ